MSGGGLGSITGGSLPGTALAGNRNNIASLMFGLNGANMLGSVFPNSGIGPHSNTSPTGPLPTLGGNSTMPIMYGGGFTPSHNVGGGAYNAMTNRLAGPQFNPYQMGIPAAGNPGMGGMSGTMPNNLAEIIQAMMKHNPNRGIIR